MLQASLKSVRPGDEIIRFLMLRIKRRIFFHRSLVRGHIGVLIVCLGEVYRRRDLWLSISCDTHRAGLNVDVTWWEFTIRMGRIWCIHRTYVNRYIQRCCYDSLFIHCTQLFHIPNLRSTRSISDRSQRTCEAKLRKKRAHRAGESLRQSSSSVFKRTSDIQGSKVYNHCS